ncbi:MAG: hypothetical protein QG637_652, partial [Chloroflexota bacterium]|nr:hypothetical protein [Chloroflexota bacterium]
DFSEIPVKAITKPLATPTNQPCYDLAEATGNRGQLRLMERPT